jgi:hypothetical protein
MESSPAIKLGNPIIIPFTIKREISTPNVQQGIDNEGQYYI